jgi:preprotein translocase subunit SecE
MTEDRRQSDEGPQESAGSSDLLDRDGAISAFVDPTADATATDETGGAPPAQLGTTRYVHAAFVAAAVLLGYVIAQFFALVWNQLAAWPLALQYVPQLVRYDEGVRGDVGLVVGAVVGVVTVLRLYRRPKIRTWADEVAAELTKVSWPDRESVTNNTIIVIVATLAATLYVTLLDKFWGFATALIYAQ